MGRTMTSDGAVEQSLDPLASAEAAAQHIVDACLKDGPVGRVGLEIEAHCYDMADPSRRPGWDELTATIGTLPPLPGGSLVTVEPGGAVDDGQHFGRHFGEEILVLLDRGGGSGCWRGSWGGRCRRWCSSRTNGSIR